MGRQVERLELPRREQSTAALVGQRIESVEARGKNLLVGFEAGLCLHVHLKMHGRVRLFPLPPERPLPTRDRVALLTTRDDAVVVQRAPVCRLIRRRDLVRDFHFRHLGPDLLDEVLAEDEAVRRLRIRDATPLGVALMDQSAVAGIGNVWKSELCFNLGLDPFAKVAAYDDATLRALLQHAHQAMRDNVHVPARTRPDPFTPPAYERRARIRPRKGEAPLSVYERAGEPCYDCGATIAMQRQGEEGRSTYYCRQCQPSRSPS